MPIAAADLLAGARAVVKSDAARQQFQMAVAAYTGAEHCLPTSSGRAALTLILLTLGELSPRRSVILPAYSCPTVVQAVLAAGLEPVFCDVSPRTLGLDDQAFANLAGKEPLAVVPTYLYGLVHDIVDLLVVAKREGIFVVEDAAQSFGASLNGRMVGTAGDFGLYSLGRGKCLPAGHGGIIVSRAEHAAVLAKTAGRIIAPGPKRGAVALAGYAAYGLATTPIGWWFVARSPLNPAKGGHHPRQFAPIKPGGLAAGEAGVGLAILSRLESIVAARQRNGRQLMALLANYDFAQVPSSPPGAEPVFLRLPVIFDSARRACIVFQRLSKAGIGVSRSYGRTLPELFPVPDAPARQRYPGAEVLACRMLTLPTNHHLRRRDFETIERILNHVA